MKSPLYSLYQHILFLTAASSKNDADSNRKTRDGKQRFAVPDGAFGKCKFLNDVPVEELQSVLRTHKEFIKSRYGKGDGKEAYVDAGDLGAEPEAYVKSKNGTTNGVNGVNGHSHLDKVDKAADSLKRNGVNGDHTKEAAVSAGAVPVDGTGQITNGVSFSALYTS